MAWIFCTVTGFPVWFAYQDGGPTATWTQVQMGAGNRYAFDIGTRGAVAYVMQNNPDNFTLNIVHGTRAELGGQGTAGPCPAQGTFLKTVNGTVTGFQSASDFATVAVGSAFAQLSPTQAQPNFTITGVPDGVRDLVATRSAFNAANVSNPLTLTKIFLKRGINPPNLSSVGTVDFNGPEAFDPATTPVTINGILAGEQVAASNTFITNTLSYGSLGAVSLTTGSTLNIPIVPAAKTAAGDVQAIAVNAATHRRLVGHADPLGHRGLPRPGQRHGDAGRRGRDADHLDAGDRTVRPTARAGDATERLPGLLVGQLHADLHRVAPRRLDHDVGGVSRRRFVRSTCPSPTSPG